MSRRAGAAATVATVVAGALATAAPAQMQHATGPSASIFSSSFAPRHLDVVAGDTVQWTNDSSLRHTVAADDGSFGSRVLFGGDMYMHRFTTPGVVAYHCTIHPVMVGDVDVHRVLLTAPREPGAPDRPYVLRGRSSLPAGETVAVERDTGGGFAPVAAATIAADGSFAARVRAPQTAGFRAVTSDGEASPAVRLLIVDRSVSATARGRVVRARVTPSSPGATVVLQLRQREHFGWWPAARARLDRSSRARFVARVSRPTRARVVLTLGDGATILARSPVVRVR